MDFFSTIMRNIADLQKSFAQAVGTNITITAFLSLWGIFDCVFAVVEFFDSKKPLKLPLIALAITALLIALCMFLPTAAAMTAIELLVFIMILYSVCKRRREKTKLLQKSGADPELALPPDPELTASIHYKRANQCIAENHPREAISCLQKCKGRITGQPRFSISYADALIQLGNYPGALAKLDPMPSRQLNKKKLFKKVMVRKAVCYHNLHEYAKELACCNGLLARRIDPEIYYFRRGQVKLRMLEVYPYLKTVEKMIENDSGSPENFIKSALEDFDKALRYGKRDEGEVLSCQGACYIHAGQYQEGYSTLQKAQKLNEFYANTYVYLGVYYYHEGNKEQAIGAMRKGISCDKEHGAASDVAFFYLAKIYYEMGEYDEAIRCAARSLAIFPHRSESFAIQGDCYRKKWMSTEAIECYKKAIEMGPKAEYYVSRAFCYNQIKKSLQSYYDMCEAVKLHDCKKYRLLALTYLAVEDKKKKVKKGKDELAELFAPYQDDPDRFVEIGIIYYKYGYLVESKEYYMRSIEHNKSHVAYFDLALVLREQEQYDAAIEALEDAIELDPTDMDCYNILEKCYRDMGDSANELQTQMRIAEMRRYYSEVNRQNGDAVYRIKKYKDAARYYQAALKYSASAPLLNNLACACYAQEQYKDAIENLEQAIKLDKGYSLAYFNLGNCQLRMSEPDPKGRMEDAARQSYAHAAELNAGFKQAAAMLESMESQNIEMIPDTSENVQ